MFRLKAGNAQKSIFENARQFSSIIIFCYKKSSNPLCAPPLRPNTVKIHKFCFGTAPYCQKKYEKYNFLCGEQYQRFSPPIRLRLAKYQNTFIFFINFNINFHQQNIYVSNKVVSYIRKRVLKWYRISGTWSIYHQEKGFLKKILGSKASFIFTERANAIKVQYTKI